MKSKNNRLDTRGLLLGAFATATVCGGYEYLASGMESVSLAIDAGSNAAFGAAVFLPMYAIFSKEPRF